MEKQMHAKATDPAKAHDLMEELSTEELQLVAGGGIVWGDLNVNTAPPALPDKLGGAH